MTWRELKEYISICEDKDESFLDSNIQVYDFIDGSEYNANVTELLFGDDNDENGWVPYLTINQEGDDDGNQSKIKETSFD